MFNQEKTWAHSLPTKIFRGSNNLSLVELFLSGFLLQKGKPLEGGCFCPRIPLLNTYFHPRVPQAVWLSIPKLWSVFLYWKRAAFKEYLRIYGYDSNEMKGHDIEWYVIMYHDVSMYPLYPIETSWRKPHFWCNLRSEIPLHWGHSSRRSRPCWVSRPAEECMKGSSIWWTLEIIHTHQYQCIETYLCIYM